MRHAAIFARHKAHTTSCCEEFEEFIFKMAYFIQPLLRREKMYSLDKFNLLHSDCADDVSDRRLWKDVRDVSGSYPILVTKTILLPVLFGVSFYLFCCKRCA